MLTQTQVSFANKIENIIPDVCGDCCHTDDALPHIVYFSHDHSTTQSCDQQIKKMFNCTYSLPTSWSELGQELERNHQYLAIHADLVECGVYSSAEEFVDAVRTVIKLISSKANLRMGVVIRNTTPLRVVKDFQRAGAQGILLDMRCYPINEVQTALNAYLNGIPYWPRELMQSLPGAVAKKTTTSIRLTPRQQQIFRMIRERGATNKAIARTLKISESTVKLHVTGIFKKFGVRNRTQLAVFSPPDPV